MTPPRWERARMQMPPEIAEVYFDFDWDTRKVRVVEVEPERIDRALLDWHLELPFWSTRPPEPLFDLRPRAVLDDPAVHAAHADRIRNADIRHLIDVMKWRGRLCILDGMHRLARCCRERRERVWVRRLSRAVIPRIQCDRSA